MAIAAGAALRRVIDTHRTPDDRVYGVVDAARDPDLTEYLHLDYRGGRRWLFDDDTASHMRRIAPYVVEFDSSSKSLDAWANRLGNSSGIIAISPKEVDPVWRFLRSIFRVQDEDKHEFYFRYYDPRVLRIYLPTCTPDEAREFFGPISTILVEAEDPGCVLVCSVGMGGVQIEEIALS